MQNPVFFIRMHATQLEVCAVQKATGGSALQEQQISQRQMPILKLFRSCWIPEAAMALMECTARLAKARTFSPK